MKNLKRKILAIITCITMIIISLFTLTVSKPSESKAASRAYPLWDFRAISTMNITRDRMWLSPDQIDGTFTDTIRTVLEYGVETGANYVEMAIMPEQKPTLEELLPYYIVLPDMAREYNLNIYYRIEPTLAQLDLILYSTGSAFKKACWDYFATIERLWLDMHSGLLRDGDVFSTFAEGDMRFTIPLGWTAGVAKYREYLAQAADFADALKAKSGVDLLYTESICGGEGRINQFTPALASRLDFIAWDHYIGMYGGVNEMRLEAKQMVEWIEEYSKKFNTRIALGEWCTHWPEPKTKAIQAEYMRILAEETASLSSDYYAGMMYFHFALPMVHIADYDNATFYYASPVIDATGPFPAYYVLQNMYIRHSENPARPTSTIAPTPTAGPTKPPKPTEAVSSGIQNIFGNLDLYDYNTNPFGWSRHTGMGTVFRTNVSGTITKAKAFLYYDFNQTNNPNFTYSVQVKLWDVAAKRIVGGPYTWTIHNKNDFGPEKKPKWLEYILPNSLRISSNKEYLIEVSGTSTEGGYSYLFGHQYAFSGSKGKNIEYLRSIADTSENPNIMPTYDDGTYYLRDVVFIPDGYTEPKPTNSPIPTPTFSPTSKPTYGNVPTVPAEKPTTSDQNSSSLVSSDVSLDENAVSEVSDEFFSLENSTSDSRSSVFSSEIENSLQKSSQDSFNSEQDSDTKERKTILWALISVIILAGAVTVTVILKRRKKI